MFKWKNTLKLLQVNKFFPDIIYLQIANIVNWSANIDMTSHKFTRWIRSIRNSISQK